MAELDRMASARRHRDVLDVGLQGPVRSRLICSTSPFLACRSKLALDNPTAGPTDALHLLNVMGPDEYHDFVNDSGVLRSGLGVTPFFDARPTTVHAAAYTNGGVIQTLTFAASAAATLGVNASAAASWLDAASRIFVPFDDARQYHPEFDSYVFGTKVKQADTILLGFPLAFNHPTFTPETLANDLAAYGNCSELEAPRMRMFMCCHAGCPVQRTRAVLP